MRRVRNLFMVTPLLLMSLTSTGRSQSVEKYFPDTKDNMFQSFDEKADERMRRVVKILRTTDKAQVNQFVPVAIEMKNVNPYAVLRFLRRPVEAEEGNLWTFVNPSGESGVVLVNVPIWLVDPIRELASVVDRPGLTSSSGSERAYITLNHRDPEDIADLVAAYLTGSGKVVADPATGSVFIEDAPSGIKYAQDTIPVDLDHPTQQIVLRAKIYEIDLNNDGTIGLDFHAWKNGPGRNLFSAGAYGERFHSNISSDIDRVTNPGVDVNSLPGNRFHNSGFNGAYFYDVPSAYFDYLVSKGRARVLTAPSATVLNTETASFSTGEEILYYKVQSVNNPGVRDEPLDPYGEDGSFPDNRTLVGSTIERADAGVSLEVTPVIGEESINMDLEISIVSQLGFDDTGVPMLSEREVCTEIRATPGSEYIIGGMNRTRSIQTTRKVPILGSIPVLGWLFGGEITTAKQTMLTMVVTAEVVDDFSGLNYDEDNTIDAVETVGMNAVALPSEIYGFDMMLMGNMARR